jgi:hypothetical protein
VAANDGGEGLSETLSRAALLRLGRTAVWERPIRKRSDSSSAGRLWQGLAEKELNFDSPPKTQYFVSLSALGPRPLRVRDI